MRPTPQLPFSISPNFFEGQSYFHTLNRSCDLITVYHTQATDFFHPVVYHKARAEHRGFSLIIMAGFVEQLWESIFVPGPTPTLLIATNISFGCLQLLLLVLLIATYSVHFLALSVLSGGLWWAINWFSAELNAAKAREEAEKSHTEQRPAIQGSEDSETEVETIISRGKPKTKSREVEPVEQVGELKLRAQAAEVKSAVSTEDEWEKVSENEKEK
ncbi:ER protein Pkr1-domain-containing protein [Poronia punctata]|nr:ER protein Pkr1-domain-containing protein [Poronia punctata]